jgi:formate dehydrogenase subunit gamma
MNLLTWTDAAALEVVREHAGKPGPMLLTLQALQAQFGYIESSFLPSMATELNVTRAELHGVLTYYSDFRTTAPAPHQIHLCVAEACQALGVRDVEKELANSGFTVGERSSDGSTDVVGVYCLGNCALGPAAQVDGRLCGRVSAKSLIAQVKV